MFLKLPFLKKMLHTSIPCLFFLFLNQNLYHKNQSFSAYAITISIVFFDSEQFHEKGGAVFASKNLVSLSFKVTYSMF